MNLNYNDIPKEFGTRFKNTKCPFCGKEAIAKIICGGNVISWGYPCKCQEEHDQKVEEENYLEQQKQQRAQEELKTLEAERNARVKRISELRRDYKRSGFVKRYQGKRLKNLTCEHLDLAKLFVDNFQSNYTPSLFFIGDYGSGKTALAQAIAKELYIQGKKVFVFTMSEYLSKLQNVYEFENKFEAIMEADLLIIDDFGREKYTEKRFENLFLFFNTIYNKDKKVIITANPEKINELKGLENFIPIFDRLSEITKICKFESKSFRRKPKRSYP